MEYICMRKTNYTWYLFQRGPTPIPHVRLERLIKNSTLNDTNKIRLICTGNGNVPERSIPGMHSNELRKPRNLSYASGNICTFNRIWHTHIGIVQRYFLYHVTDKNHLDYHSVRLCTLPVWKIFIPVKSMCFKWLAFDGISVFLWTKFS